MEVVSAEVNSLLPEEIMDTGITLVEDDSIEAVIVSSPMEDSIPMETELEEMVNIRSTSDSSVTTTATVTTESVTAPSNHSDDATVNTTTPKPDVNAVAKSAFPSGLHKLGAQTPVTISANQIILNKTADIKIGNQSIKPDGQKLILTTLGKSGQPIVLALPHSQIPQAQKAASQAQSAESKVQGQQIKVVIGGRSEVKPVGVSALAQGNQLVSAAAQPSVLQTQQLKTVQIAKKTRTPTSGPVITKLIFAKPINSKAVTGQTTQVSPVIAGRVLTQSAPGTPPKTITISESGVIGSSLTTTAQQTPNKIAISPLKSPSK
ncbi:PREDICTED: protein lin-54 homolog, partial [Merops nubicus]|uniref:protein lin-54 homolog n=1 Tax=Merops nubicus TaxID=57421 RepID=UPI0004F0088E